jgi:hypothetical protein
MRTILALFLLSCGLLTTGAAQAQFDVKINGGGLFFGERTLAFEYFVNPEFSLQLAGRFHRPGLSIQTGSAAEGDLTTRRFDRDVLVLWADARWYPAPTNGPNTRWFVGGQVRSDITTGYDDNYDRVFAAEHPFGDRPRNIDGLNAISVGAVGGYKALIANRLVIEPSVALTRQAVLFGDNTSPGTGPRFRLYLGLRF